MIEYNKLIEIFSIIIKKYIKEESVLKLNKELDFEENPSIHCLVEKESNNDSTRNS